MHCVLELAMITYWQIKAKGIEMQKKFMQEALLEARAAFSKGEVPVGAILVYEGRIIARGHNLVEQTKDATAHAEMICLREAAKVLDNWRLLEATLYCTLEPCPMCAGAMILSRVKKLVWGAPDLRHGADGSLVSLLRLPHPIHQVEVEGGVLAEECADLMREFFKRRRNERLGTAL